jgi:hypothetical protein
MATTPQQGIMALPQNDQEQQAPELGLDDSYDAIRTGLGEATPDQSMQVQEQLNAILPALDQLTDEQLDALLQIVQYLHDNEKDYAKIVAQLVRDGVVDEGIFPDEYNPEVIATLGMVFLEARRQRKGTAAQAPQPPMTLAKGGIADAARMVASRGRYGDTMLAHINKKEAALLKKHGGSGAINPDTGLPEYWGLGSITRAVTGAVKSVTGAVKSVVNGVVNTVKSVVNSPIGRVLATAALATFLGPGAFGVVGMNLGAGAALGLASAGVSLLGGANLKEALTAGAKGYFAGAVGAAAGAPLGGMTGVTSAAGQAALGAGAAGTGLGLLTGKNLKDSVKEGLTAATIAGLSTGASKGFNTPADAGAVKVDPTTGKVTTGGAEVDSVAPKTPAQIEAQVAQQGDLSVANQPTTVSGTVGAGQGVSPTVSQMASGQGASGTVAPPVDVAGVTPPPPPGPTKGWTDTVSDWYDKNLSPSGRAEAGVSDAIDAQNNAVAKYQATHPNASAADLTRVGDAAFKAATPGVLSNYGPMIGAGLGATALMGGFKPQDQPQMSPEMANTMSGQATRDLMAANPKDYLVQNLPGVQYDAKGNIIGSTPWTPRKAAQTEVGSDSYIPFTLPTYNAPTNSIGSRQVQQPYNTADMYTNLMPPRYAAEGGFMQSSPAFPGTPLTMDSGPMMAQQARPLAMNTPGVPMNQPMGFADGGIASLNPQHFSWGGIADTIKTAIQALKASDLLSPITDFNKPAAPSSGGGGIAPAASAVASGLQNAGYAPIVAPSAVVSSDAARSYDMQKAANDRLAAYHARQAMQNNLNIDPSQALGDQLGQRMNPSLYDQNFRAQLMSGGQRAAAQQGSGIASLAVGGYPRRTGQISGPGTETSDDIPAMLSDGEFVMTAKAVKGLGGGSRRAGAKKMYALMHRLEKNAARG